MARINNRGNDETTNIYDCRQLLVSSVPGGINVWRADTPKGFPDAGWRVFLGLILQRIDSKQERIDALEDFYREWQDIISK